MRLMDFEFKYVSGQDPFGGSRIHVGLGPKKNKIDDEVLLQMKRAFSELFLEKGLKL